MDVYSICLGIPNLPGELKEIHLYSENISVKDAKELARIVKNDFEARKEAYTPPRFQYGDKNRFKVDYNEKTGAAFLLRKEKTLKQPQYTELTL